MRRFFDPVQASMILSMPLSRWGCADRFVWHFTRHGNSSVKTGYHAAQDLGRSGLLGRKGRGEGSRRWEQKALFKI